MGCCEIPKHGWTMRRSRGLHTATAIGLMTALFTCSSSFRIGTRRALFHHDRVSRSLLQRLSSDDTAQVSNDASQDVIPPWNSPTVPLRVATKRRNNNARFRQHVNPLARAYQNPTLLPENWPGSVFTHMNRPLHLDIGCGKGGFLIDLCLQRNRNQVTEGDTAALSVVECNYLGLEIRPGVAAYAKDRIATHKLQGQLDFLGCNANVDLERLLKLYHQQLPSSATASTVLQCVTIQFPDPHFKTQHAKRRVVTPQLIDTLAKYMPTGAVVFLQSDVQTVLDDMRLRFRECDAYFVDSIESATAYVDYNVVGVPTEREGSVLIQGLPVFRSLLTRNATPHRPRILAPSTVDQGRVTNKTSDGEAIQQ